MNSILVALRQAAIVACLLAGGLWAQNTPVYFAPNPGSARADASPSGFTLSNAVLSASWKLSGEALRGSEFKDLLIGHIYPAQTLPFTILFSDGRVLTAAGMHMVAPPEVVALDPHPKAARMAERIAGTSVVTQFADQSQNLHVTWRVILRNGSNYVRQEVAIEARASDVAIREVRLIDWELTGARVVGTVAGSPVVAGDLFTGLEDPLASCAVAADRARCWIERELPLRAGQTVTYSSVAGVTSPGQLRRGFLYYIERERAHPYRTFLHYNSWYDLGYFSQYDEAGALRVINAFGTELTRNRGVPINSFLFDDGWDDPAKLWQFNAGFPDGFTKVRDTAATYGTAPGVWMSPWGGYGKPKQQRVAVGSAAGFETIGNGFALSGPKYYQAFRDTCFKFVRDYGVNQFKFDGTGNADRVFPGSQFDSDFAAAIHLIGELRTLKPDLFINLTTGTYPSPFWLRYADSIWRGGEDHEFLGVGPAREQWITYRDADTYEHVVLRGPLFPLNSLMLHGIIYAQHAKNLNTDPQNDFPNEVRDYFGTGTQLQELYITPTLLSQADWDVIAEAALWSRKNADALADTHWVGGDPSQLEVYGWASWNPDKAILVLRNPAEKAQTISIDIQQAFELPANAKQTYSLHSPWKADRDASSIQVARGQPHVFVLKPFQVLVLEGVPVGRGQQ
jgi:hypothetical protein